MQHPDSQKVPDISVSKLRLENTVIRNAEFYVKRTFDGHLQLLVLGNYDRLVALSSFSSDGIEIPLNHILVESDYTAEELEDREVAFMERRVVYSRGKAWLMKLNFDGESLVKVNAN